MPYADLHVHTTASDGELTLNTLPDAARDAGVSAVAVTDHDTLHPGLDAPLTDHEGVEVVRGIELRVEAPAERVDLLGYGVTETPALRDELDRLQADRIERGQRIVENVEEYLGVDLGVESHEGFGRPHVARAVVAHPDTAYEDVSAVFADLIGDDGPCYVARDVTGFEQGRDLLADACGAVGLAHPLRYEDPDAALALCADLDAVEVHYPYDRPVGHDADTHEDGPERVRRAVEEHDLLALGGSDAHGDELGTSGVERGEYRRLRRRIRG
ncbi:PHP domain-containing protein [Halarchaeum sp. P4]|uniref:PHP domain-containing protein n=1 Tax=Halarchaeum sp. P4 TaxID=3421639 RepID=UPI003EBF183D